MIATSGQRSWNSAAGRSPVRCNSELDGRERPRNGITFEVLKGSPLSLELYSTLHAGQGARRSKTIDRQGCMSHASPFG